MKRKGYINIKEAAAHYEVSRAKLHRLINLGRLQTATDPRDERVTLLQAEELESLFHFPTEEVEEVSYEADKMNETVATGRLTAELRGRIDALRKRISGGRTLAGDSTAIIREERERRSQQIYRASFGASDNNHGQA